MSGNLEEAKVELERGLRVFKAFENAHRVVEALQGIEQNERELQASLAKTRAAVEVAKDEHTKLIADLTAEAEVAQSRVEEAKAAAERAGKAVIEEAEQQARRIIAKANEAAEKSKQAEQAARATVMTLNEQAAEARGQLQELEGRIARAKTAIASILKE